MKMKAAALVTAAALLVPAAGQAQAGPIRQDFCHGLKRVVNAAREEGGFGRLARARAAPPHLGFRHGCRSHEATGTLRAAWQCGQNLAPEELSLASLAERTAACLPEAVRTRGAYGREAIFTLPHARILMSEHGGPRAHVGRIVSFRVEAIPAP